MEPGHFTSEQIEEIANVLFDGFEIYSGEDVLTKSMIEERIISINESISRYMAENDKGQYDYIIGKLKDSITRFEGLYNTATNELPKNPPVYEFENSMINLYSDIGGKEIRYIAVYDSGDRDSYLLYTTGREYIKTEDVINPGADISKVLNYTAAKGTADQYLNEMGIDYMDISYMMAGQSSNDSQSDTKENHDASAECCYVFYYTRSINGISATYVNEYNGTSVTGVDGEKTYRAPWDQEYIEVFIDEEGIASLTWKSPTNVTGYESENVVIMSLDEAENAAKKRFSNDI